ncbi:hypothetical protein AMTR_s00080p00105360 [Amborella trichopoda]|uniref:Uncharacterized protein n=1 Tax=Amborella trichopoda TaxID=13333 RepID=W1PBD4_AMBTC|nr:hypothetical protein AMTR_s00080p00105360 [Amborella trichopoda]
MNPIALHSRPVTLNDETPNNPLPSGCMNFPTNSIHDTIPQLSHHLAPLLSIPILSSLTPQSYIPLHHQGPQAFYPNPCYFCTLLVILESFTPLPLSLLHHFPIEDSRDPFALAVITSIVIENPSLLPTANQQPINLLSRARHIPNLPSLLSLT